jgi:hypothetical protein
MFRVRAIQIEDWDQVAWLICHIPTWKRTRRSVASMNPHRKSASSRSVSMADAMRWAEEVKDLLPDTLTREQIDERWEEVKGILKNAGK